jgi:hypothetical protein
MQPTQLFQRCPQAAFESKALPLRRSSEEHRLAPRYAEPQGTAETTSDSGFIRVKQGQVPQRGQQPLFADETWQVRGVAGRNTSAKQLEKCAAWAGSRWSFTRTRFRSSSNKSAPRAAQLQVKWQLLNQGHASLSATSVA